MNHEHRHGSLLCYDNSCGCGHDHEEDGVCILVPGHKADCGHDHVHGEGCGHDHGRISLQDAGLSDRQADVLLALHQRRYLPVARFALRSTQEENAYAVAMEPVYVAEPGDTMDIVRENGALFASLKEAGMITLDYDLPLAGYDYPEYKGSALYAYFVETVKEAASKPGFVMDIPCLELGSIALTQRGHETLHGGPKA